ncbi:MAG: hypothetical protein ABEJ58_03540 [Halodesulfurarchaeum sp.]
MEGATFRPAKKASKRPSTGVTPFRSASEQVAGSIPWRLATLPRIARDRLLRTWTGLVRA